MTEREAIDAQKNGPNTNDSLAGDLRTGRVGIAKCRLMRMRPLVDFAHAWMAENR